MELVASQMAGRGIGKDRSQESPRGQSTVGDQLRELSLEVRLVPQPSVGTDRRVSEIHSGGSRLSHAFWRAAERSQQGRALGETLGEAIGRDFHES